MRNLQLLTGTPVNKPTDAYSYIKLLTPEVYRSVAHFENEHVEERDFFQKPIKFKDLDVLKRNLELRSISRTKEELHGYNLKPLFPDCHYDLAPEHMSLYVKLVEEQLLIFDDGTKIDATSVARLRHALQQVVVNFDHFSNNTENKSNAYALIDQTVEETRCALPSESKLIIWTKYKRTSRAVTDYCNALKIKTVAAYSEADSEKSIRNFMVDDSVRILVAQYQSAGSGLNPQHVCSQALFLELDTVPMYIRQALGRLDRVGQTKIPIMRLAVARGTVQESLHRDLLRNDDLVQVVEPSKKSIRSMLLGEA